MNPAVLLAHFDRISDAKDVIARLRLFIVDLAVRGKLVEQVQAERVNDEYLNERVLTFLPRNWRTLNFGNVCDIQGGNQPPKSQFVDAARPGYVRLFQIRDLGENPVPTYIPIETTNRFCRVGEILIGRYGASVGKIFWAQDGAYNVALAKFIYPENAFIPRFAFLVLKSRFVQTKLTGMTRSAQAGFNKGDLAEIDMPLPPLAEQHRIVAKVDELMALCDRLEAAQRKQESRRHQLAVVSFNQLGTGSNGESIQRYGCFCLSHFTELTSRPGQIRGLRRAILDLAVRGRLVPQDSSEESASELLKRIQAEKARRMKEGILRKDKSLSPIAEDEAPFGIPPTWSWTRIGTCALITEYGTSVKSHQGEIGIPILAMGNIQDGQVILDERKKVPRQIEDLPQLFLKKFDLLYNRTNSAELVGKTGIFMGEDDVFTFASYLIRIRFPEDLTSPVYSNIAMNAPYFRPTQIVPELRQQCGQANVNGSKLRNMLIPLPPFSEQRRIVAKVEELMALCDRLEEQIAAAQTGRSRLLEALLRDALDDGEGKAGGADDTSAALVFSPAIAADIDDRGGRGGRR